MIEHHIQRTIIDRLAHASALRFSELKPVGMESNIFMYHLKQLIKDDYVQKDSLRYSLAAKGLSYVDGLSTQNLKPRSQPKLICIIALSDSKGRWLLAERKIQPYIGTRMFISGKQHRGETSGEHAVRELHEKTGFRDISLKHRGMADVQICEADGRLLTHAVAQIYTGTVHSDTLPTETERFRFAWHDFKHDKNPLMPGTEELHQYLLHPDNFDISIHAKQL